MHEPFVIWEDKYSVSIKMIDDQHKRLIEFTNKLFDACQHGTEAADEEFRTTIKDAVNYVRVHFADEEALLGKYQYPGLAMHKQQHRNFVMKVIEQVTLYEQKQKFVPNNFVRFLRDWLLEHIAITDHEYKDFLKEKGIS